MRMTPAATPRTSAYLSALTQEIHKKLQRVCIFGEFSCSTCFKLYVFAFVTVELNLIFVCCVFVVGASVAVAETQLVARAIRGRSFRG